MLKEFLVTFRDANGVAFEQYKTLAEFKELQAANKVVFSRKLSNGEVLELAQFERELFGY